MRKYPGCKCKWIATIITLLKSVALLLLLIAGWVRKQQLDWDLTVVWKNLDCLTVCRTNWTMWKQKCRLRLGLSPRVIK